MASFNANKTYLAFFIDANGTVGPVALGFGIMMAAQKVTFFAWKRSVFWLWPVIFVGIFAFQSRKVLLPSVFAPDVRHWGLAATAPLVMWPYVLGMGVTLLALNLLLKRAHTFRYAN